MAGCSIGLLTSPEDETDDNKSLVLTDLMGFEDYAGDMDFKVAGGLL